MIKKTRRRYGGYSDDKAQSHRLFHLVQRDFPGLSFNPATAGKLRLDQNDGQPVPLAQIPTPLTGKDADTTDGKHLPSTLADLLTDHDKAVHDDLRIDADTLDGYHAAGLIRPSSLTFLADGTAVIWTDMAAALGEFLKATRYRLKCDLTKFTQSRILVNVATAGYADAKIRAQYSTDQSTWYYLDGSSGPSVSIASTGLQVSFWVDLAVGARAEVFLRLIGIDGDGVADPAFGLIALQCK